MIPHAGKTNLDYQQANHGSYAGMVLMFGLSGAAWWLKGFPVQYSAYIIGIMSTTGLGVALWLKNRGNFWMNAEVLFLGGAGLQYFFAPVLLRLLTNNMTDFWLLETEVPAERADVHDAHSGGMCLVLTYMAVFFAISYFIPRPRSHRGSPEGGGLQFSRSSIWLIGALLAVLWGTRLLLLKTGSYYHLNRSEFQFEDPRYSLLAQIDAMIGPLVVTYFFIYFVLRKTHLSILGWAMLALDSVWNFISGSRERALMVFITLGVTYVLVKRQLPIRILLPAMAAGLLLISFMDHYRYAMRDAGSASEIKVTRVLDALDTAKEKSASAGLEQTAVKAFARLNDLDPIAAIYAWVPDMVDYLGGETYLKIPLVLVPRAIWPDKPQMILPINDWFFVNDGGSSPTTLVGEGFLNFGWAGVILAAMGSAFLLRQSERFICRFTENEMFLPIYVSFLLNVSRIHVESAAVFTGFMLKYCVLMYLAHVCLRMVEPRAKTPSSTVNAAPLPVQAET
jgi:hypothetical protein